jgi:hypothetical protein
VHGLPVTQLTGFVKGFVRSLFNDAQNEYGLLAG